MLLIGPRGLRRATDGKTFEGIGGKVGSAQLFDYDPTDGSAVIVYGNRSIFISTNRGASWKRLKDPVKRPQYSRVDFVSRSVGYALMLDGRLYKTKNGGRKWSELFAAGESPAFDMSFGDANDGFLSLLAWGRNGQHGWVLRTSDGGATWRPQLIESSNLRERGLVAMGQRTAFALDNANDLFETTIGGDLGTPTKLAIKPSSPRVRAATRRWRWPSSPASRAASRESWNRRATGTILGGIGIPPRRRDEVER